jgi:hypothetical protein
MRFHAVSVVSVGLLAAACGANDGPGPASTSDAPTPAAHTETRQSLPPGLTPLAAVSPWIIVAPVGTKSMCQPGAIAKRGDGAAQVRYVIVGKECASPVGTKIENTDSNALVGSVAAVVEGSNKSWTAVLVQLESSVGWTSFGPPAKAELGDKVTVYGLGSQEFTVETAPEDLLRLKDFTVPFGRSGAPVTSADNKLVAIASGDGGTAIPIDEVVRRSAALPGLDGLQLP